MRTSIRIVVVTALALGAVAFAAVPSGAGAPAVNTFVVEKHVSGPAPAGTTFTVEVVCESILQPHAQAPTLVEITFDADGNPTSDNSLTTPAGSECTATETDAGGAASTSFACAIVPGDTPGAECGDGGNSAAFFDVIGKTATITVTNTFAGTPTTPTTPPLQPVTPAAQAVQAAPTFTG
jgi:hypothetical protein